MKGRRSKSNRQLWVSRIALVLAILAAALLLAGLVNGEIYPTAALFLWICVTILVVALALLGEPLPEKVEEGVS